MAATADRSAMISHVRATLGIREVAASYGLEFDASGGDALSPNVTRMVMQSRA